MFAREWANRAPLVIVPTKYYSTPTDVFRKAGISVVIWANHLIRAATVVDAGRREARSTTPRRWSTSRTASRPSTRSSGCRMPTNTRQAEEHLPRRRRASRSAAIDARSEPRVKPVSRRSRQDRPKVMLPIAGKPLLRWLVDAFKKVRASTTSPSSAAIAPDAITAFDRRGRHQAGRQRALCRDQRARVARDCAIGDAEESTSLISYGDLLFRSYILRDLVERRCGRSPSSSTRR